MFSSFPLTISFGDNPESMDSVLDIVRDVGAFVEFEVVATGEDLYRREIKEGVLPESFESIARTKLFLKAPTKTPNSDGYISVMDAFQQKFEPQNTYLTISEQPAWSLLEQLVDVHPRLAHYTFRHICQLPPFPGSKALIEWLESNTDKMGRVVEPDLRVTKNVIFDLSMGSRELGNLLELSDVEVFTRQLFDRMKAANSHVGIGRYNEARPIYTAVRR